MSQLTPERRKAEANERFLKIRANIEGAIAAVVTARQLANDGLNLGLPDDSFDYVAEAMGAERLAAVCKSLDSIHELLREAHDSACRGKAEVNGGQPGDAGPGSAPSGAQPVPFGAGGVSMSHGGQGRLPRPTDPEKVVDRLLELAGAGPGGDIVDRFFETCK
jgi:hypothetical protein